MRNASLCVALLLPIAAASCRIERPGAPAGAPAERPAARASAGPSPAWRQAANLIVERNVAVPMRDGVMLRADLYRPAAPGRYPTLVYRTPYGKDDLFEHGSEALLSRGPRAGYAVVVQDVRGRYNSDGEFRAYHQEGQDGYDTIEWAAAQPWSDGRIGTFGLSYPGAVQWLLAMERPPHLVSIVPAMTFATGRHFFYYGGAFNHDWMRWIELYIAPDVRRRGNLPGPRTGEAAKKEWDRSKWTWWNALPLRGFPRLKAVAPWYDDWLAHPDDGPYWSFADVTRAHAAMTVAALHFTGWFDGLYGVLGATTNFNGMRAHAATPEARRAQRLIVGPWTHGSQSDHDTRVGDLDMGPNATIDYPGLILDWQDRWLRGARNGIDEWPPVRIFVMGENVWRDENEWPPARAVPTAYYLRGGGAANTAGGDGRLSPDPPPAETAAESPDHYLYDPRRPVVIENLDDYGARDQASIESRRDVLVYTTAPLEHDLEVTGPITADLWVASSAPDTDFGVMVCDVHPDGRSYNLLALEAGYLRARYRTSESAPELLTPGAPTEVSIGGMLTSNLFRAGHRIRIQVTSSRFPVFDRNPNTGEAFGVTSRMVPARQTIYHDAAHPSHVTLPILPR
jgi:uncharacterized protein